MTSAASLDGLKRGRPEWTPWLAVVEEVLKETGSRRWDAAVPRDLRAGSAAPLLAGATVAIRPGQVRSLVERLVRVAVAGGTPKMLTLEAALTADLDVLALLTIALSQDSAGLKQMAVACGADAEALQAVAALVPVPFLQACNCRFKSSLAESWMEGYCPVCGSWPAFAEVRGIERSRHFRCGRCGSEWHARALRCPFCSIGDHDELVTLVPERSDSHAVIDACKHCLGYIKTFSRLQGCAATAVMIDDLASVALDIAALEQGYRRPDGAGYSIGVTIAHERAGRRFFAWS